MFALTTYSQDAGLFTNFHASEEAALNAAVADVLELVDLEEGEDEPVADYAAISMFCNDWLLDYQFQITKVPG